MLSNVIQYIHLYSFANRILLLCPCHILVVKPLGVSQVILQYWLESWLAFVYVHVHVCMCVSVTLRKSNSCGKIFPCQNGAVGKRHGCHLQLAAKE